MRIIESKKMLIEVVVLPNENIQISVRKRGDRPKSTIIIREPHITQIETTGGGIMIMPEAYDKIMILTEPKI